MDRSIEARESGALAALMHDAGEYARRSKADNTKAAYVADWADFTGWCERSGVDALPSTVATVTAYITHMANTPVISATGKQLSERHAVATIERRLASISKAHQAAGFGPIRREGILKDTLQGIRRVCGVAQDRAAALRVADIRRIVAELPDSAQGLRDRALLLVGYAGALRRSELVALTVEDIEFTEQGAIVRIRRSKTNQTGEREQVELNFGTRAETCPVRNLRAWLDFAEISTGPVFRSVNRHGHVLPGPLTGKAVGLILKRIASAHGLDARAFSGHSLRAGFITDQYAAGTAEAVIMKQSRHKSRAVLTVYYREAEQFAYNYAAAVGL